MVLKLNFRKVFLGFSVVALLFGGIYYFLPYLSPEDPRFLPKNLIVSDAREKLKIITPEGALLNIAVPVGLAFLDQSRLFVCNYSKLYLLNINTGVAKELPPPSAVKRWVPTGLAYCAQTKTLYVANYTGKDTLAFTVDDKDRLHLKERYTDAEMVSPEGVAVTKDGSMFVVADYDGHRVFCFKEGKKFWSSYIGHAHGVSFSEDEKCIYASGLLSGEIYKLSLTGEILARKGAHGFGKDGYLWPTSVSVYGSKITITDAHTGQICILNDDLNMEGCVGGNGPGEALFNMPYGIAFTREGFLYVADTLKDRIVKINPFSGAILTNYEGHKVDPSLKLLPFSPKKYDPLGKSYKGRLNLESSFSLDLPHFGAPGKKYFSSYNGFYAMRGAKISKYFLLSEVSPVMNTGFYYWTFGANYTYQNKLVTLLGVA